MPNRTIPLEAHLAAKRGFARTTAQAFASTIPTGGVSVATVVAFIEDFNPVIVVATIIAALSTPLLAGLASYFSLLSRGIPEEYVSAAVEGHDEIAVAHQNETEGLGS